MRKHDVSANHDDRYLDLENDLPADCSGILGPRWGVMTVKSSCPLEWGQHLLRGHFGGHQDGPDGVDRWCPVLNRGRCLQTALAILTGARQFVMYRFCRLGFAGLSSATTHDFDLRCRVAAADTGCDVQNAAAKWHGHHENRGGQSLHQASSNGSHCFSSLQLVRGMNKKRR